jgi:hypothetical protein
MRTASRDTPPYLHARYASGSALHMTRVTFIIVVCIPLLHAICWCAWYMCVTPAKWGYSMLAAAALASHAAPHLQADSILSTIGDSN